MFGYYYYYYNYFSYLVKQISPVIRAVEEVALVCDKTEKPEGLHVSIFITFNSMHKEIFLKFLSLFSGAYLP